MTIKEVAQILLSRQNAAYSFILDGATRTKLTPEGFEYARHRGWLEIDEQTSCMRICMRQVKLNEIKAAATAETSEPISPETPSPQSSGHDFALSHVSEVNHSTDPDIVLAENQAQPEPSKISGPDQTWRDFMPFAEATCHGRAQLDEYNPMPAPTPSGAAPNKPAAAAEETYEVGDMVVIGEDGKTYQATVQAKQADGSLVLSFGTQKPSKVKPSYNKQEVTKAKATTAQAQKPAQPATAQPQTAQPTVPSGPTAPGLGRR